MDQRGDLRGWEYASVKLELDQFLKGALTLWELVMRDRFQ